MSDRELLEKAAKAAGIELVWDWEFPNRVKRSGNLAAWNPLDDDGDALRLMAKLRLDLDYRPGFVGVHDAAGRYIGQCSHNDNKPHDAAATRHAIVRAAAAIGESHE